MPKVSQAYRDQRRGQILDAARRCFLRSGIHQTSMQDLFTEAGLSSGAVYLYFTSKDDIVMAIVEEHMLDVLALIHSLATEQHDQGLGPALADVLCLVSKRHQETQIAAMAVHAWSEALSNPSLAARFDETISLIRSELSEVVRGYQVKGALPGGVSAEALTGLFSLIVPGFILQLALFGPSAVSGVPDAIKALWPR